MTNKKAVMISIHPEWCAKIAQGKKTVEIRKSRPKLDPPFRCYIYCTKGDPADPHERLEIHDPAGKIHLANGKVIGEFTCDKFTHLGNISTDKWDRLLGDVHENLKRLVTKDACLSEEDLHEYGGKEAWHISNFLLYDKPKSITDFWKADKCPYSSMDGCTYPYHCFRAGQLKRCGETLEKAPQSWCYVSGQS